MFFSGSNVFLYPPEGQGATEPPNYALAFASVASWQPGIAP
jgi:hypothetical protein